MGSLHLRCLETAHLGEGPRDEDKIETERHNDGLSREEVSLGNSPVSWNKEQLFHLWDTHQKDCPRKFSSLCEH